MKLKRFMTVITKLKISREEKVQAGKFTRNILIFGLGLVLLFVVWFAVDSSPDVSTSSLNRSNEVVQSESAEQTIATHSADFADAVVVGEAQKSLRSLGDLKSYKPQYIANGSQASYDLNLKMEKHGQFNVNAKIKVSNVSADKWDKLVFYMIPNVFTDAKYLGVYRHDAKFKMIDVRVNGKSNLYSLEGDTLSIPLKKGLSPKGQAEVEVIYEFKPSTEGIRLLRTSTEYQLTQWHPMLATYVNGWNKQPYKYISETYHTDFSDYTLQYELPDGYQIMTSSDDDSNTIISSGRLKAKGIKEFTIMIAIGSISTTKLVDDTEIRIWGKDSDKQLMEDLLPVADRALRFLNEKIGPYPHKQLDVVLGDHHSMEYPGIVTVNRGWGDQTTIALVHEIAHQWFYGMVSNDPYYDGWVDEGMTELVTSLFFNDFTRAELFTKSKRGYSNTPVLEIQSTDIGFKYYGQPAAKLKKLFDRYGIDGMSFAKTYFDYYKYKQVDTKEFVRFIKSYFGMKDDSYFKDWIQF
ncbi:M1 family metallopeptidase [Paenibacillus marinisediminis]